MDYTWARRLGLVRKPANFISSISDDRGDELSYAGMPISEVFSENIGIGGVVSLLWFRRRLPDYATTFIEMILMVSVVIQIIHNFTVRLLFTSVFSWSSGGHVVNSTGAHSTVLTVLSLL
jgi:hypothetical protein